jgi:hypothetical protein
MENRNYTVEQQIPSKTVPDRAFDFCLANRPEKPHFNQDGIKRGGVAQAPKFSD